MPVIMVGYTIAVACVLELQNTYLRFTHRDADLYGVKL